MKYLPTYARMILNLLFLVIFALSSAFLCTENVDYMKRPAEIDSLYKKYKKDFPDVPEISVDELIKMQKDNKVILVDERDKKEQKVSMIPHAIKSDDFNIDKYSEYTVVVYCTIGSRSGHFVKDLPHKDINAYNLKGGVLSWAHAGKSFVDEDGGETKRVHVYGSRWDLLPKGYEAVW
jgi:rhodanese-related sulfurtransferase